MTEKLLQYIWQFQHFNRAELCTTTGEKLLIVFPGKSNSHQGPDFLQARVQIGSTLFAGSVELHLATSHWNLHRHSGDEHYKNVVLHVVYQHDLPQPVADIPVLELQPRVPNILLQRFEDLMKARGFIPCQQSVGQVPSLTWLSWKERLLAERLQRKAAQVLQFMEQNNNHWEESFWWLLARVFGNKVNADAFEAVARSLPIELLARHKGQIHHLEALLFGQSALLEPSYAEKYPQLLQREYRFLQKKYQLQPIRQPLHFLRMRPGNFPSVRLAQLSMLMHQSNALFTAICEEDDLAAIRKMLSVTANDYWHDHYRFDEPSAFQKKSLGAATIDGVLINAVVPMLFAWGSYHGSEKQKAKALLWLEHIAAEQNHITRQFEKCGVGNKTAFDSQALLELKAHYCDVRKCLSCAVGNFLLKA